MASGDHHEDSLVVNSLIETPLAIETPLVQLSFTNVYPETIPFINYHLNDPTLPAMGSNPSLDELFGEYFLPTNVASVAASINDQPTLESLLLLSAGLPCGGSMHGDGNNHPSEKETIPAASSPPQVPAAIDVQVPPRLVFIDEVTGARFVDALGTPLGEGKFGAVYKVKDQQEQLHALKVPKPTANMVMIKKEAGFLRRVKGHKNVAEFLGEVNDARGPCLLMRLYKTQDFFQVILMWAPLSEDHVRYFGRQLAEGLEFIHEAGVTHCDLKPQNILVAPGMQLRISDFGLSEEKDPIVKSQRKVGTPEYWAPEVVEGKAHTAKLDLFSLGIVFYNMFTRKMPKPKLTDTDHAYRPEDDYLDSLAISAAAKDLLDCCLKFEVSDRADAAYVLRHGFFRAGSCPKALSDELFDEPSVSGAHGAKHSRSNSAQEVTEATKRHRGSRQQDQRQELHVKIVRSFKVKRAAKRVEWKEILERVIQEQAELRGEEDELREVFGSDFRNVRTNEDVQDCVASFSGAKSTGHKTVDDMSSVSASTTNSSNNDGAGNESVEPSSASTDGSKYEDVDDDSEYEDEGVEDGATEVDSLCFSASTTASSKNDGTGDDSEYEDESAEAENASDDSFIPSTSTSDEDA
ncbi:Serine/threonine-protein kinase plk2 [Mortierella sp. 14UC]|nr:Serine/threonine-protein kinase plk2 [Mortierella sp. 14UC]